MANPPLVNSISYGSNEASLPSVLTKQFNNEAMKAGTIGVSIFVSSGDDGAAGSAARSSASACGYAPSFPATSPYVTAVGATQGPESNSKEVVCSSKTGGVITSGGGFSTKYAAPSWQTAAIATYLKTASPAPVSGYSKTGRGYPDLALAGFNYQVVIGGKNYAVRALQTVNT
jgi:tripeptidyl-peptidase-1